jgi:hypothetical protein
VHAVVLGSAAALPASPTLLPGDALPAPAHDDGAVLVVHPGLRFPAVPPGEALPARDYGTALVVLHPGLDVQWSPPPPLQACFDAAEIEAAWHGLSYAFSHRRSYELRDLVTWRDVDLGGPHIRRCCDARSPLVEELFRECEGAARASPAAPESRFIVVARRDRSPATRVLVAPHADLDDRLRCCLERTGEWLASTLGQEEELRYVGGPDRAYADVSYSRGWPEWRLDDVSAR